MFYSDTSQLKAANWDQENWRTWCTVRGFNIRMWEVVKVTSVYMHWSCPCYCHLSVKKSVEECNWSFLTRGVPFLFFLPYFFCPRFLTLLLLLSLSVSSQKLVYSKAYVALRSKNFDWFLGNNAHENHSVLPLFKMCVSCCVFSFSAVMTVSPFLSTSEGYEEWKRARWCVPCLSSSPASRRSSRFSPAMSSRCWV